MRYLLTETGYGYCEMPLEEDGYRYQENIWQFKDRELVFCLSGERRLFWRDENLTVSSGEEAVLRIPALKSRFYIRGMRVFYEAADEDHLYRNQRKLPPGDFQMHSGDVLFLRNLKLEVWEDQIAVWGSPDAYKTVLPECPPVQNPEGFPVCKRSPRLIKRPSTEKILIEFPKEKEKQKKKELLMAVMPPLGMAAVTFIIGLIAGRGVYLILSAAGAGVTALFSVIKYMDDKRGRKERNQKREEQYREYLWGKKREITQMYEQEQEIYAYQYPDTADLCEMVRRYDSRIYERMYSDNDFLTVLIGHYMGKPTYTAEGKKPAWDADKDLLAELAGQIVRRYSLVDKPKAVNLKKAHLGLTGAKDILHQQIKILTVQLAFFHSYHDLQIIAVYDPIYEEEFAWMRWLPHLRLRSVNVLGMVSSPRARDLVLGSMYQILKDRAGRAGDGKKTGGYLPHYLFLIDEPAWILNHGIMEYLYMDGSALGFSVVYTSDIQARLPEFIGTMLSIQNSEEGVLLTEAGEYLEQGLKLYDARDADCEWMARNLGVLVHEQRRAGQIPEQVTFFEMYGIRHPEELDIKSRWKKGESYKSLAVPLGMRSRDDVLYLNLHEKAHGPHGLIAGTTGSGKSELIQSYILSLAVNFHPHEVGFLLIDYKGGGMASLFHELPHHLGTITNLDGQGSVRALISVKAELSRRQRIFGSYHVNHINGYMKLFKEGTASEAIPHLFIISDEFAELKKEQPDFMKELISAARIGRSLGVHLILATQKPSGVVDEQIWSNSRFKLCLKVQEEMDSKEVLRTMDAANIAIPGRAYLKVGNNETYELFQAALSKAPYREDIGGGAADERIYVVNELGQGELVNKDLSGREGEYRSGRTQLEAAVEQICKIAEEEGKVEVKKPWMPPLKSMLISPYAAQGERKEAGRTEKNLSVCIGKLDIPEMQEQREMEYCPERDGNLLFVASAGFGKTVFLTTVLTSFAVSYDVDMVNFYIVDCGNHGCMPLKELPHTAEYISLDDEERYQKFKKLIMEEITARKKMLAKSACSSWETCRDLSGSPRRAVIVAVDQLDVVKEMGIEEEEFFMKLTRDGMGLGIYTIAAAARVSAVRQATLNNFKNKLAGYNFDENETFLAAGRTVYRQTEVKGRVLTGGGESVHEAQLYVMADCTECAFYTRGLKTLIQEIRRSCSGREAPHIPVLPQEFGSGMLRDYTSDGSSYLVGLDAEEVVGKGFDQTAGLFVIIGNTGTGKTNILKVLADQAGDLGKTYLFDSKSMELYALRQNPNTLYVDGKKALELFMEELSEELKSRRKLLQERLQACPGMLPRQVIEEMSFYTVLIDDLDDFAEFVNMELDRIAAMFKEGRTLGVNCIVTVHAAKVHGISEMDRMVKQAANGLVLGPQGVVPIFPVASMREYPKFGDGLLFKNGVYRRVRIPESRYEEKGNGR